MNANIVIINGKVLHPIKPTRHYFTVVLKCGDEEICVHIPKKMYRFLADPVKKMLTRKNEFAFIEGFIDNGQSGYESPGSLRYRIIANNVNRGNPDTVNVVILAGVICEVQKQLDYDNVSLGILEGQRMVVVSGNIPHDRDRQELHVFETVKLAGKIEGQKIVFTGLREV